MSDERRVLICNPDEPGFVHGASMSATATAPWCRHRVKVSASGVSVLMTTPGMVTCCIRCMPLDVAPSEFQLVPEVARQFEEETGEKLTPGHANVLHHLMRQWVLRQRKP
jgi:hypothetical protein